MAKKQTLLLLLKNPFAARDYERMGIATLKQCFELYILDCSAWLMPKTQDSRKMKIQLYSEVIQISSLSVFRRFISKLPKGISVDYVGQFSIQAILMFYVVKSAGFKIVVIDSGAFPVPQDWRRLTLAPKNIAYAYKSNLITRAMHKLGRKFLLNLLPNQRPDIALVAGNSWRTDPRFVSASVKVPAHSFDYENYRQINTNKAPVSPSAWALYIDECLPSHEDNEELGYSAPVTFENFSASIRQFFDQFEQVSGIPVKIAGYPSINKNIDYEAMFGKREVIFGQTAELVKDASVVFAHASTAISYAVLWRRPLAFLISNELRNSWYMPWISAPQSLLQAPLVDIDDRTSGRALAKNSVAINIARYQAYEDTYLRSPDSPDLSLWDIFSQGVNSCSNS